jgi:ABC-type amino acid transport substrate-binding protein
MRRTVLLPAIVLAMPFALLAATEQRPAPAAPRGTLDRLRAGAVLHVGYRTDARPLSFKDENGRASGYSVALCQIVIEAIKHEPGLGGIRVDWMPATIENRFDALREGSLDLLCGASTVTLARREQASFSIPIFPGGIGAIMRADAPDTVRTVLAGQAQTFEPVWEASAAQVLRGHVFAAVQGTTGDAWLAAEVRARHVDADVMRAAGYDAGVQAVADGKADAIFGERAVLFDAARRHPAAASLLVVDRFFTFEPLAIGLPRGDDDLRLIVDRTLSRLYTSGEINPLYSAWFGAPDAHTTAFFRWSAIPQ